MANYLTTDTDLTAVADAIRTKGGTSAALEFPDGFVDAIDAIETGGGSALEEMLLTGEFSGDIEIPEITSIGKVFGSSIGTFTLSLPDLTTLRTTYSFENSTASEISAPKLATLTNHAFHGCQATKIVLAPNFTIPDQAFYNCTNLVDIDFSEVTAAGAGTSAFENCTSLRHIWAPKMTGIAPFTQAQFRGCTSLISARFPNAPSNRPLRNSSFMNCTSLKLLDIGSSQSFSHASVLSGCAALEILIIRKTSVCTMNNVNNFTGVGTESPVSVYVPSSLISSYQTASNWSTLYSGGRVEFLALEGSPYEAKDFVYEGVPA